MAFFRSILKANKLNKAKINYHDEKLHAIEISKGIKPHYTFSEKIRMKKIMLKMKMIECIQKLTCWHEDSWSYRTITLIKTEGTLENFLMKSLIGFLSGILLTYILFLFIVFHLRFTLFTATLLCSLFGMILTIGLAFSHHVRCVVLLLLPQFFSKRGRQALIAYAFILALTGPTNNTLQNIQVLSESLTCGQEELAKTINTTIKLIKQPFYALHDSIAKVLKSMKEIVKKIEKTLLAIKRVVVNILKVIKSTFSWLGSIVSICNKKIGTPFERCSKVFEGAIADCQALLGPFLGGICNLTYIVSVMCYLVKPLDFICILISFTSDVIVDTIGKKLKKFSRHVKTMFYVKVNFTHSYHFETNKSKSYGNIANEIVDEMKTRAEKFHEIFDWMSLVTSFFILCMVIRVLRYYYKWLTNDRYDNKYLTSYFRDIDLMRAKKDKETVLPLNRREKKQYIPLTSMTLIAYERNKLLRSAIFLGLTTFQICIHMGIDYSLFWVLDIIRYHGQFQTKVQHPNTVGIYVSGSGYLAELYRSIVQTFSPKSFDSTMDTLPCLPDPLPPDYDRYAKIVIIVVFCWIMAIFEPYGLRIRQIVMSSYHPERAKQRAVYLYNKIIRSRGSFLKFARRQLRRKYGMTDGNDIEQVTLRERLLAICPILNICFAQKLKMCLLCGVVEREGKPQHFKCPNPTCVGLFCIECFADLQNICTICKKPMEYGDLSDISEEKDSSDDDAPEVSAREQGEKLQLINGKLVDPETRLKKQDSKKLRDDVTIQIFHESLRGGGDFGTADFLFDSYKMNDLSFSCKSSSTINDLVSLSTEELAETELMYMEFDENPNRVNCKHLKIEYLSSSQSNNDQHLKSLDSQKTTCRNLSAKNKGSEDSYSEKCSKKYKHKSINSEGFINSSISAKFSLNEDGNNTSSNMNEKIGIYHHCYRDTDDTDSTNDDHQRDQSSRQRRSTTGTQYLCESTKCYAINERNPKQSDTWLNPHEGAETLTIDSDSVSISDDPFSFNGDSDPTPQLSNISNLSINIDTQLSSERQRRREVMKWYHEKSEKE